MSEKIDYAVEIRRIRRERDWNTAEMGEALGVSARTVEGYEQGRVPSGSVRRLLGLYLGNTRLT